MKTELHNYDIFPKVIPSKKKSRITVRPLGGHAEFRQGASYTVAVCPLDEGAKSEYPGRPNFFEFETAPDPDGSISFEFDFFSEQQYYVRIKNEEQKFKVQLCVYAVVRICAGAIRLKAICTYTPTAPTAPSPLRWFARTTAKPAMIFSL